MKKALSILCLLTLLTAVSTPAMAMHGGPGGGKHGGHHAIRGHHHKPPMMHHVHHRPHHFHHGGIMIHSGYPRHYYGTPYGYDYRGAYWSSYRLGGFYPPPPPPPMGGVGLTLMF